MARQLDFAGKSGANYRYTAIEDDRIPPTAGANYIIAETGPGAETRLLYAGETENVMAADLAGRLDEVRQRWPAAELLLRLNGGRSAPLSVRIWWPSICRRSTIRPRRRLRSSRTPPRTLDLADGQARPGLNAASGAQAC